MSQEIENRNVRGVFLSHHSSKAELVAHLSKYFERNGITTWYAPRDIAPGKEWDNEINKAIQESKAVILLFCSQADSSRQVKRELALADKYNKPIFWLRVERVEPDSLSYFLTSTQWFDWMDARDDTLEQIVSDLKSLDDNLRNEKVEYDDEFDKALNAKKVGSGDWCKGVLAFPSEREAAECTARVYFDIAQKSPDSSVILPTGRSATLMFRAMLRIAEEYEGCPFGEAILISDTETFGVWKEHETSRTNHIQEMLIEPLKRKGKAPDDDQIKLLSGIYTDSDPIKNAQKIIRMYPPVIHGVSVSPVGEILAYEVGTYNDIDEIIDDAPRIVEVGEHSRKYIDPNQPSKSIITIGMGTALSSNVLLILAYDLQKANIISRLMNGTITAGIPATILKNHPNCYIITTESVVNEANIQDMSIFDKNPKEAAEWIISN